MTALKYFSNLSDHLAIGKTPQLTMATDHRPEVGKVMSLCRIFVFYVFEVRGSYRHDIHNIKA